MTAIELWPKSRILDGLSKNVENQGRCVIPLDTTETGRILSSLIVPMSVFVAQISFLGDGPAIPVLSTLASAVEDALSPFDVKINSMPIPPEKVMRAIRVGMKA